MGTDKNQRLVRVSVKPSRLLILTIAVILSLWSGAALEFRTEDPVDFFSDTDMNQNKVTNLSDPINSGDAVPLDFVQGKFVERGGDTFAGDVDLNGNYILNSPSLKQVPSYKLIGYWAFQDERSYAKDWSKYGNDGNIFGGSISDGKVGGGIRFNGEGQGIDLEATSALLEDSSNFSLSAWFKTRDRNGLIIGSGESQTDSGYWLSVRDGELEFRATSKDGETVTIDTPVSLNNWRHATATSGNGSIKLYLDGSLEVNESFSGELADTEGSKLYTGVLDPGKSETNYLPYNGKIDELRAYSRSLKSSEAKTLYQMGLNGKQEVSGAYLSREQGGSVYGDIYLDGVLDMSGNDITNPGDVDGVDLDDPGNAIRITNSSYELPENSIENEEINNSRSLTISGLESKGNINLTGKNLTNVNTVQFISGASVNGSINATGDINLNNGSLTDIDSIDGGGDSIKIKDNLDIRENNIVNVEAINDDKGLDTIRFDGSGNVSIYSGNLNLNGDRIEEIGSNGSYFNSAGDMVLADNRSLRIQASGRPSKVLNLDQSENIELGTGTTLSKVEIPSSDLDLQGNELESVGRVSFQDRNQDSESLEIAESTGSGDLQVLNESGYPIMSLEQQGSLNINSGDLNMESNRVTSVEEITGQNSVNKIELESGPAKNMNLNVVEGGLVQIEGGNLGLDSNSVTDRSPEDTVKIGDGSTDSINLRAGGDGSFSLRTGDRAGSSKTRLEVTQASGNADIDVSNADIDMNSNSIKGYYGSQCPPGESMIKVRDDGSFLCRSISTQVSDLYVNRAGDSMTGDLNMNNNQIDNISRIGVKTPDPQQNLDVDGTASIQNSGTEMELDSDGNVVITLG